MLASFTVDLGDGLPYNLVGVWDLIDHDGTIVDNKGYKWPPTRLELDQWYAEDRIDSTFLVMSGDVVTDFDLTQAGERIDLRGVASITGFADLQANHIRLSGSSAVIDDGVGNMMVLSGIDPNMLQEGDFLF